jgi:hypothetical protein
MAAHAIGHHEKTPVAQGTKAVFVMIADHSGVRAAMERDIPGLACADFS